MIRDSAGRTTAPAEVVDAARLALGARVLHVEQVCGWLDSVLEIAHRAPRFVLSVHDFGLFCRRPHLLERPAMRFCNFSRDEARCRACLAQDWPRTRLEPVERRGKALLLLERADAVIFPSEYLRRSHRELFGWTGSRSFVIAPPVVDEAPPLPVRDGSRPSRTAHVAFVGSLKVHKGAAHFESLVREWQGPAVNWSAYGGGDPGIARSLRRSGVAVHGYYRVHQLSRLLARHRVDLALLLSVWPEAYGMTFDECTLAGVPVVARDHGAIAERIRRCGGGRVISMSSSQEKLVEAIAAIVRGEDRIPASSLLVPTAGAAARRLQKIYRSAVTAPGDTQTSANLESAPE